MRQEAEKDVRWRRLVQKEESLDRKIENELINEKSLKISQFEAQTKEEADSKARELLTTTIQRCAAGHVAEATVSVVPLP